MEKLGALSLFQNPIAFNNYSLEFNTIYCAILTYAQKMSDFTLMN